MEYILRNERFVLKIFMKIVSTYSRLLTQYSRNYNSFEPICLNSFRSQTSFFQKNKPSGYLAQLLVNQ